MDATRPPGYAATKDQVATRLHRIEGACSMTTLATVSSAMMRRG